MKHDTFSLSVAGRRRENEDAILSRQRSDSDIPASIVAVADGMGGHAGGQQASNLAIDLLRRAWDGFETAFPSPSPAATREWLRGTFSLINSKIRSQVQRDPSLEGMGTTLVVAVAFEDRFLVANVGDSRAYLLRDLEISQLTHDHTAVAESVRNGQMTELEAMSSPFRHALTRSLDGGVPLEVDFFPDESSGYARTEDTVLLLCSDGLSGAVSEAQLLEHVQHTGNLEETAAGLVGRAHAQGSKDNISTALLELGTFRRRPGPPPQYQIPVEDVGAQALLNPHRTGLKRTLGLIALLSSGLLLVALLGILGLRMEPPWWQVPFGWQLPPFVTQGTVPGGDSLGTGTETQLGVDSLLTLPDSASTFSDVNGDLDSASTDALGIPRSHSGPLLPNELGGIDSAALPVPGKDTLVTPRKD